MKAYRIHQYGPPEVLQLDEIPEPTPKSHEVKIQVKASGLNHLDVWVRSGSLGIKLPLPLIPGADAAGVVVETGSGAQEFKKGDRVFVNPGFGCGACQACRAYNEALCLNYQILGEHGNGTHCQFLSLPEKQVLPLPSNLTFEEGAAFPLVFMTSYHMLAIKGQLRKGETALIMAGGSGIGSAGIQIAKALGARTITTVGCQEHQHKVKELGADFVIDHYKEDMAQKIKEYTDGRGVDVILEHVGAKVWMACLKSLAKGGRLVTCGGTTGAEVSINLRHLFIKHHSILGSTMGNRHDLETCARLMAEKKLKPVIHQVLPCTRMAQAHEIIEKGKIFGKVVLDWNEG